MSREGRRGEEREREGGEEGRIATGGPCGGGGARGLAEENVSGFQTSSDWASSGASFNPASRLTATASGVEGGWMDAFGGWMDDGGDDNDDEEDARLRALRWIAFARIGDGTLAQWRSALLEHLPRLDVWTRSSMRIAGLQSCSQGRGRVFVDGWLQPADGWYNACIQRGGSVALRGSSNKVVTVA